MTIVDDFWNWVDNIWGKHGQIQNFVHTVQSMNTEESLANYWKAQSDTVRADPGAKSAYEAQKALVSGKHAGIENPLTPLIMKMLDDWKANVAKYDIEDPAKADEKLASLAADVMSMSAAAGVVELALGAFPDGEGTVASTKVSQLMGWLGFGAVVTAVAHDPVKIGLLRPYQDLLEAQFRNRRPGDNALFQAYRTRELTPTHVDPAGDITDALLAQIETENQTYYDREIAKWGYSEWFAGALARSATRTPSFGNLTTLARQGLLTRGMAVYSLWGYGMDKLTMKPSLDALMALNDISNYAGFRTMIEPSFSSGDITEEDLVAYYDKIHVPKDVQGWILPRLRKSRAATLARQTVGAPAAQRDLTVSQIQQAYQNQLMERGPAQNAILTLGYNMDEAKILLDLAEMRRKLPAAQTLKKLTLTDYEKAYKNGLITQDKVLDRMRGEYTPQDIDLERQLLQIGKA
jgi:hypothetical protein